MRLTKEHEEYMIDVMTLVEEGKEFEAMDKLRTFIKEGKECIDGVDHSKMVNELLLNRRQVPLKPDSYNFKYVTYAVEIARNILGDLEERRDER